MFDVKEELIDVQVDQDGNVQEEEFKNGQKLQKEIAEVDKLSFKSEECIRQEEGD